MWIATYRPLYCWSSSGDSVDRLRNSISSTFYWIQAEIHQKYVKHASLKIVLYYQIYPRFHGLITQCCGRVDFFFLYWNAYPKSLNNFSLLPTNLCDLHFVAYSFCMQGLASMRSRYFQNTLSWCNYHCFQSDF